MVLIFTTYLFVLGLLLIAMVKDRLTKVDGNRFLISGDFWEVYFICISLTVLAYLISTSKELGISDSLTLN